MTFSGYLPLGKNPLHIPGDSNLVKYLPTPEQLASHHPYFLGTAINKGEVVRSGTSIVSGVLFLAHMILQSDVLLLSKVREIGDFTASLANRPLPLSHVIDYWLLIG